VVDRFEGRTAVVVADDGRRFDVPRAALPAGCREGTVLRLDGAAGKEAASPDWSGATIDEDERRRRLERLRDALRRMGESDPGGDVAL
jgi:hypothetical protein